MQLSVEVFFHTEETETFKKIGIDYPLSTGATRSVTFYNISLISPFTDKDGEEYCSIHSNGSEFICSEPYEVIKERIEYLNQIPCKQKKSSSAKQPD
jgi:hypothetical protein